MLKVTFLLRYKSFYGERLFLKGSSAPLQGKNGDGLALQYTPDGWTLSLDLPSDGFSYSYYLVNQEGQVRSEPPLLRTLSLPAGTKGSILVYDVFEEADVIPSAMLSGVFTNSIMHHQEREVAIRGRKIPISFNIRWPNLPSAQDVCILGNTPLLGSWNQEKAVPLCCSSYPEFCTVIDATQVSFPLEYKYVTRMHNDPHVLMWESGDNHYMALPKVDADFIVVNDGRPRFAVPHFRGAGTAVPVFSLRSRHSFGVGQFSDLKLLADWAAETGQRIIQMLPINDTTVYGSWKDSYPYSAISVFALNPLYLDLEMVGSLPNYDEFCNDRDVLNDSKAVDFENVVRLKWKYIKQLFSLHSEELFKSKAYNDFYARNKHWLDAYAVFCVLRDKYHTCNYELWGPDAVYNPKNIEAYCSPQGKDFGKVALHFFVQYHLDKQLHDAVAYAHNKGVAMKGDIPIGVNRHSVEVWMNTRLFDCNGQAGAPPDYFSKFGQNWGFPIYNWEEMKKDGYSWWCNRLKKMNEFFDAYRIDHILGFFRIFRIPSYSQLGLLGQFCPALPLSVKEICSYGIDFKDWMLRPFIHQDYLPSLFGKDADKVVSNYLVPLSGGLFKLRPEVDSQQKIDQAVPGSDKQSQELRLGLKILTCQVLFVEDSFQRGMYHPRISVGDSFVFKSLSLPMREAMGRLYNNFFFQRHNKFWADMAMQKLPALIKSSNMMVCGEDLGMVPACVRPVMQKLGILSLEIQRMPKDYGLEFGDLEKTPYLSVSTSSSHDMSTMRQWWEEDRSVTKRYYNQVLKEWGDPPLFCEPWICQRIIESHLKSDAMWVILPLQDWMAMDGALRNNETFSERINNPADPDNKWRYRMHITLEDLLVAHNLNQKIFSLVRYYGRM